MEYIISIFIGLLYACGVYLLLRGDAMKLILGVFLLINATNLIIFFSGDVIQSKVIATTIESDISVATTTFDSLLPLIHLTVLAVGVAISLFILTIVMRRNHTSNKNQNNLQQ